MKGSSAHLPACLGLHSPLIAILAELGIGRPVQVGGQVQIADGAAPHAHFEAFHPGDIKGAGQDGRIPLGPRLCALVTSLADPAGGLVLPAPALLGQLLHIERPGAPAHVAGGLLRDVERLVVPGVDLRDWTIQSIRYDDTRYISGLLVVSVKVSL